MEKEDRVKFSGTVLKKEGIFKIRQVVDCLKLDILVDKDGKQEVVTVYELGKHAHTSNKVLDINSPCVITGFPKTDNDMYLDIEPPCIIARSLDF